MTRPCRLAACGALSVLPAAVAWAQPAATPDKSSYTLFDPTPDSRLRDFTTDRPGKAQEGITVDAGHVQLESDLVNFTYDYWSPDGTTTRQTVYGAPELRLGVSNWAEIDVTLPLYTTMTQRDRTGATRRIAGLGDLQVGGVINFFGNEGGDQSLGMLVSIKIPTAVQGLGNNMVEGTALLPYVIALPARFSATLEAGAGFQRNAAKQGYALDTQFLASLSHPIGTTPVTAAVELALDYSTDHNTGTRDTVDATLQWQVTRALALDCGVNLGITKAAADFNPYVGIATRF